MDRINRLECEIADIRKNLNEKENELYELKKKWLSQPNPSQLQLYQAKENAQQYGISNDYPKADVGDKLPRWAIERYSRQILLPDIGVAGQVKICAARVLVVGAGGLGCPVASYLAGAGVGEIGLVDYDTVDLTNIHRQLLHGEPDQHMNKVESAANALRRINSHVTVTPYNLQLDSSNALQIISKYQLVLDCTDNVPGRYLLNDACQLMQVPLISGSALKMEGQLTIYNYKLRRNGDEKEYAGPCYRCLFETPPPPETVGSCSADGVCGPVPGVIGCLQALEAIKLIVGLSHAKLLVGRMLIFDGEDMTFRVVKLRPKNRNCAACSQNPTITALLDYETFCRTKAKEKDLDLKILGPENRITAKELAEKLRRPQNSKQRHLLVDVRTAPEFQMCRIEGAVNWPVENLDRNEEFERLMGLVRVSEGDVTFLCRRGNDSQLVARQVLSALSADSVGTVAKRTVTSDTIEVETATQGTGSVEAKLTADGTGTVTSGTVTQGTVTVKDLTGGLHAWAKDVDEEFPIY